MKTDFFQSCGHCWVFQICWHIECSTFTASSFRIWNTSTGIPSLPGASVRNSACGKGHEEGGSAYAKAGSSLRSPPGNSRASTPKTRVCLLYCFMLSPTPLTLQGAVPHHHLSLWKRVNLQLQLIKFLGVTGVFWLTDPSEGSLTCLTGLPGRLQLCIRLFTVCQLREAWEA